MSKELIEQLRDLANCRHDDLSIGYEAADRIEQLETERDQLREQVKMLSAWIKQQGEITDTCTFHLLREVCENCACHRNKALAATEPKE